MPTTLVARCVVHIDGRETSYLRAGLGPPIVFLRAPLGASEPVDGLTAALSPHHRLSIPNLPPAHRVSRLRSFLDGIGLECTHVLATNGWVVPALAFALTEPERVDRLALLDTQEAEEVVSSRIDRLGGSGHPLFVASGTAYNGERSGLYVGASITDALIHFFSGAARGSA